MPSEPSREELIAQVASLQSQLATRPAPPASSPQPTPQQLALVRSLLDPAHRRVGKDTPEQIAGQIVAIRTVITSGVNSAGYGDKRTEFRSLNDLREILNGLENDLADALGLGARTRQIRIYSPSDKGL